MTSAGTVDFIEKRALEIARALPLKKPGLLFPEAPLVKDGVFPVLHALPSFANLHKEVYEELLLEHGEVVDSVLESEPVQKILMEKEGVTQRIIDAVKQLFHPERVQTGFLPGVSLSENAVFSLRSLFTRVSSDMEAGGSAEDRTRAVTGIVTAIAQTRRDVLAEENTRVWYRDYSDRGFQEALALYMKDEKHWNEVEKWHVGRQRALKEEIEQSSSPYSRGCEVPDVGIASCDAMRNGDP